MNRTVKDATVKRLHRDSHAELGAHFQLFLGACNHTHRLKALHGLTRCEFIRPAWTQDPNRFRLDAPHHTL